MALGFVKLNRSDTALALLAGDPKSFNLLTLIAFRASRETGEAFIGDWKAMGATSEAAYRRTKKRLQAAGLATFKPTNRGTIAKLVDTRVFDINIIQGDEQSDEQPDDQSLKKATSKATTNKKFKKFKPRNKEGGCDDEISDIGWAVSQNGEQDFSDFLSDIPVVAAREKRKAN